MAANSFQQSINLSTSICKVRVERHEKCWNITRRPFSKNLTFLRNCYLFAFFTCVKTENVYGPKKVFHSPLLDFVKHFLCLAFNGFNLAFLFDIHKLKFPLINHNSVIPVAKRSICVDKHSWIQSGVCHFHREHLDHGLERQKSRFQN